MTIPTLQFELERRVILFKSITVLPDGSLLGYNGDPNLAVKGNTPGETLIYNSPKGTRYQEDDGKQWYKKSKPNFWIRFNTSNFINDNWDSEEFLITQEIINEGSVDLLKPPIFAMVYLNGLLESSRFYFVVDNCLNFVEPEKDLIVGDIVDIVYNFVND